MIFGWHAFVCAICVCFIFNATQYWRDALPIYPRSPVQWCSQRVTVRITTQDLLNGPSWTVVKGLSQMLLIPPNMADIEVENWLFIKKKLGTRASGSLSCCSHLIWSRLPTSFLIALSVHNRTSVEWQIKSLQREWRLCSPYVVRRTPPERASILSSLERFNHCAIWADFLVLPWLCSNEIGYEHCWQDN